MRSMIKERVLVVLFVTVFGFGSAYSQETKDDKKHNKIVEIQNWITSGKYKFVAETVMPMTGRTMHLTSVYDLVVSGDTVRSDLPYFGRAYQAPIDPTEGGINFSTTDVKYSVNERKKGGWEIVISPKNRQDVRQMFLTVSDDGYATLRVESMNRQSISFDGYITL